MKLRIATYNIHKGVTGVIRRNSLSIIRSGLHSLDADIVFLQEVQDRGLTRLNLGQLPFPPAQTRSGAWQLDILAGEHYAHAVYGKNVIRRNNHHGNAILSRYPVLQWENIDVSDHRLERRSLLHTVIQIEHHTVHAICLHLGLFAQSRERQIETLITRVTATVPATAPLLIAGDFNDWRKHLHKPLMQALNVHEVFAHKEPARTFPSRFPWLQLDRIYVRGATVHNSSVARGGNWGKCSDHRPLLAELTLA